MSKQMFKQMSKQCAAILAGISLTLTGCSEMNAASMNAAPSMGTLRHRGKSYDLRRVVTADAKQRQSDPFLRHMAPETTFARSNEKVWAGQDISNGQIEDNLFVLDQQGGE